MVSEIKRRARTWEPMEVDENPLSNLSVDEVYGLMGMPFAKEEHLGELELVEEDSTY